ncbi:hypothetical protein FEM48_Zijuj11G0057800 [Ziziphus jujuba var. spinosa]|uniref:Tf2-1-like SH3-like domain-containing protein n=1 Tax=Ziziphus jujuba var. spinosa TaxID=714518 RepID=A0A978UH65_ZIZJJ|nr:hypothetical protein FEM48_Zijuj11G0057800 [Ziziphus jujuba var. spinosa]
MDFTLQHDVGERKILGPQTIQNTSEIIVKIKERMKAAQNRVIRFGKKGKLSPRFVGPFKILDRVGD